MTILTKIQNTRNSIKNYIIPFLVVLTLYIIFHIPVDDFLYTTANRLQNDIILFWLFIAATAIVYIFGLLIWLEYKNKFIKYQVHQKLRKYKYTLKALAVIGGICTVWRILHFYPTFNNPQINFDDWCYIGIAASLCINVAFLLYISWLYGGKDNTTKTDTDKKEIKADSVETAVVEIEGKNEPNEPFIIARNGLKSVIDRVYSNNIANIGNESYIIGVNGEWGSGKSTLIELVKRQMKDDVHIIDFNPWTSHQPANLPVDFFRTIAASIGSFTMRRTIVHYGLALTKIAKKDIGNVIETLFGERSLDAQLKDIGDYIRHRNLKLLIIIDDIDRMDGDEILAVLKLARRSGNLPNTVYLLAFNHDYVEAQICQKIRGKNDDGNDSFNYIDKIVNLPFDVPKYTPDYFVELLKKAMPDSASQYERDNFFLPDIIKNQISNFRSYKKIYNKIILQYYSYKDYAFLNDFIVLKTLQLYHHKLYTVLINASEKTFSSTTIHYNQINNQIKSTLHSEFKNICEKEDVFKSEEILNYIFLNKYGGYQLKHLSISSLLIDRNSLEFIHDAPKDHSREFSTSILTKIHSKKSNNMNNKLPTYESDDTSVKYLNEQIDDYISDNKIKYELIIEFIFLEYNYDYSIEFWVNKLKETSFYINNKYESISILESHLINKDETTKNKYNRIIQDILGVKLNTNF